MKRAWRFILWTLVAGLVGAAIFDQLRRPLEERTWQGQLGFIPYDFRLPTPERIREKLWNKDTPQVLTPHLFGVGWSINFYPLLHPELRG
jgi:hypothetical protein